MSWLATSPICDQGGECDLQDQAMVYGSDRGRFYEYKRSLQDKNAGPLIKTIMTRCIHCTRCIRYATEIAGIEVYGTTGRGKGMEVGTYISNLFNSEISGNVIDLCPVGALTSKPYAFTVRPWELKSIESIDIFDAMGSNIRIDIKGSQIMRVLPKANNKINQQWISDKTRFAYDGLKCQRLYYPMIKQNAKILTVSWKKAIDLIKTKIVETKVEKMVGIIGHFVDQETIISFKKILNQLGVNKRYMEYMNNFTPTKTNNLFDFRSNFISKLDIDAESVVSTDTLGNDNDIILLIGCNPRYETSMLNIRLRQMILKKKNLDINIWSIGSPLNLTYPIKQLGTNLKVLYLLAQGKSNYCKQLIKANSPIAILSNYTMERQDGKGINKILNTIFYKWEEINKKKKEIEQYKQKQNIRKLHTITKKLLFKTSQSFFFTTNIIQEKKNRINVLHAVASAPGSFDLGFTSYKTRQDKDDNWNQMDLVYLLGADCKNNIFDSSSFEKRNTFIIYQGHHGCNAAKLANVILPSTSFIEKKGTYLNLQGYIQETQTILNTEHEIYHDWQILQKIANELEINGIISNETTWNQIHLYKNSAAQMRYQTKKTYTLNRKIAHKKQNLQIILNHLIDNNFVSVLANSSKATQNKLTLNLRQEEIFHKIFENITPNLKNQHELIQTIYPNELEIKVETNSLNWKKKNFEESQIIYLSNLILDRDNFYLSDIITKSSITMGKCSAMFKNHNFTN